MRRLLKFLVIGLGTVIGILLVAVLLVVLIPDKTYRGWLTSAVQSATGCNLAMSEFSVDIGSTLTLDAGGVVFANADWGQEPAMFSADRLWAEVALQPLLSGILDLSVSADRPRVALETDATGRGNWDFGARYPKADPKSSEQSGGGIGLNILPTVKIAEGRIDYVDGVGGNRERFDLNRLDIGEVDSRLNVEFEGQYRGEAVTVSGDLGELPTILTGQMTGSVAEARFGAIGLTSKGRYANLLGPMEPTIDLALTLNTPSTASIIAAKGAEEEARISAEVASDWLKGQLDARIEELRTFKGVQGGFDLDLQSLALL